MIDEPEPNQDSRDSSVMEMNNSKSVLHKIASLYADQLMSDIILVVGNNRYPAHRVILCASSEVFQVMLMNPEWNECRESVIELKEDPSCSQVFPQFLKYLYVGQIRISLHTALPLLALADKYNIKDLVQLCVDYMLKHVAKAAANGFLVSWLQYTVTFSPYHQELTDALQKFLKFNLEIVAESKDFIDLDVNILIVLLQQNDLVLESEYTLFGYIEKWLLNKQEQIEREPALDDDEKHSHLLQIVEAIVCHIRFAMMTPTELSKLLLRKLINLHTEYFVGRMAIAMSYHSGQIERVEEIRNMEGLQFTPRLYKTDIWGLSMTITDFDGFENYRSFAGNFFSQSNLSECQEDQNVPWEIDFFPRGIRYHKAKLINIYNQQGSTEIPESILKTVRLRVTCRENLEYEQRFKIGVLITGVQNLIPHIKTVHVKTHYFSSSCRVLNLDNLLPYEELALSALTLSPHLIGLKRNTLCIQVVIAPMGPFVCADEPPFELK